VERIQGKTPGGKREYLHENIPLKTPFLIQIFPVYACNFKCAYCIYSIKREKHGYISKSTYMDLNLYKKAIDDLERFPKKLKMLRFAGIGEPLLHPEIAEMIAYAKKKKIAESVDIVTNGVLLTEELSLRLVDSGLDRLRVSIQGISKEKYKEISGVLIDFNLFLKQLQYFYDHKKKTSVYIKIIDCALDNKREEEIFYKLFEDKCDNIAIEHLTPTVHEIDYSKLRNDKTEMITQSGNKLEDASICPQPFYMMQINPDGNVVPCCSMEYPIVIGNLENEDLYHIWNGKYFNAFRLKLLDGVDKANKVCSKCTLFKYGLFDEDRLEEHANKLKNLFKEASKL